MSKIIFQKGETEIDCGEDLGKLLLYFNNKKWTLTIFDSSRSQSHLSALGEFLLQIVLQSKLHYGIQLRI